MKITFTGSGSTFTDEQKHMTQMKTTSHRETFLNDPSDCQWLLETALRSRNLNNAVPFAFQSFCLFGNEDCPTEILIYRDMHPNVSDVPARATLMDNGRYSFIAS